MTKENEEKKVTLVRDGIERKLTKTAAALLGKNLEGHEIKSDELPKDLKKHVVKEPATTAPPAPPKAEKEAKEKADKAKDKAAKEKDAKETKEKYNSLIEAAKNATDNETKYSLLTEAHEIAPSKYTENEIAIVKKELGIE